MPRKPVKKKTRKTAKRRVRAAPQKAAAVNWSSQGRPQKRTSMWLGEDLLLASANEAARLGISRSMWVQMTLRKALGMPAVPVEAPPIPENSVFA